MKTKKLIYIIIGLIIVFAAYPLLNRFFYTPRLNRDILDRSLELGKSFLLNNQTEKGNFVYEYDFSTKKLSGGDSQVRQAGALWGLSLIHHENPSKETYLALKNGFRFFDSNSITIDSNSRYIAYPNDSEGRTGTIALVCLAYIEVLQTPLETLDQKNYSKSLDGYLNFLLSLRKSDGHFHPYYDFNNGSGNGEPNPYFDGESLLTMSKAAKYAGYPKLKKQILESAENMYEKYVIEAGEIDKDSRETKGFYQWGSMSFFEIYSAGWGDEYADRIIDLAYWMIDTHKTLWRRKNTAYAHEGMITAWQTANMTGNKMAMRRIGFVIDRGLYKLTSWQVGGPVQNKFLQSNITEDPMGVGGIMNCKKCPNLRIDVTQHQMHAVILARRFVYK